MKWTTYRSTQRVKARKVTSKDGERIVTQDGPQNVAKGDYVLLLGDADAPTTATMHADEFEAQYGKVGGGKKTRKSAATPTSAKTPPEVAGTKDEAKTADPAATAAARVKAAREAKAAAAKKAAPARKTTPARR
jgi:hypothetical protein